MRNLRKTAALFTVLAMCTLSLVPVWGASSGNQTAGLSKNIASLQTQCKKLFQEIKTLEPGDTLEEKIQQYENYDQRLDKLDDRSDDLEDRIEALYRKKKLSKKQYKKYDKQIDRAENYLDKGEDRLEGIFGEDFAEYCGEEYCWAERDDD